MSAKHDRDQLVAQLARELPALSSWQVCELARKLRRAGATLQRLAELECSSEWHMNQDRVPCPAIKSGKEADCLCDQYEGAGKHEQIPRITVQGKRLEARITKLLAQHGMRPIFNGDPRGAVFLVIPPSYAERNAGRDEFNLEGIYVS